MFTVYCVCCGISSFSASLPLVCSLMTIMGKLALSRISGSNRKQHSDSLLLPLLVLFNSYILILYIVFV